MKPLGEQRRHFWLLQRMARKTGVDLVRAFDGAAMSGADWAETVRNCRTCDWTEGCEVWLRGGEAAQVPPKPCRNRARLAVLKVEQEVEACR